MIGKQCFNNFVEILSPKLWNWWRKRTHVAATTDLTRPYTCWEQDYQLQDPGKLALFDEYLEMSKSIYKAFDRCFIMKNIILQFYNMDS